MQKFIQLIKINNKQYLNINKKINDKIFCNIKNVQIIKLQYKEIFIINKK